MLNLIYKSQVSACFEFDNNDIFYTDSYSVSLNGSVVGDYNTNVFSLYNLTPNTKYAVTANGCNVEFCTPCESCCYNVVDFGAVGNGIIEDTLAFQIAINCLKKNGRLFVPSGTYLVSALTLKSNMTLHLAKGAVLLGHTLTAKYPLVVGEIKDLENTNMHQLATWEGDPVTAHQSLISAYFAENINIVGEGIIDGNAQNSVWWEDVKNRKIARPRLVFLNGCEKVNIHGITGQNSASWHMHPYFSKDINFYNVNVNAQKDTPNTDGCNPESCDNVKIIGCIFSVGDDCIAIKSGKIYMGAKYKTAATNHVIRNCLMQYGHGAVVLGSEMAGGIKNLSVTKCLFKNTDRGLRIKSRRGRGKDAIIDGITFEKIKMEEVLTPLVINMFYFCDPDGKTEYVWSREKLRVDERTPYLGKFTFKDMICDDCSYCAGYFDGLPEMPIKEITIENVEFNFKESAEQGVPAMRSFIRPFCKEGLYFDNVEKLKLKNIKINGIVGEKIISNNLGELIEQ